MTERTDRTPTPRTRTTTPSISQAFTSVPEVQTPSAVGCGTAFRNRRHFVRMMRSLVVVTVLVVTHVPTHGAQLWYMRYFWRQARPKVKHMQSESGTLQDARMHWWLAARISLLLALQLARPAALAKCRYLDFG